MSKPWKEEFPRLYDLFEKRDKENCENYFGGFQDKLKNCYAHEVFNELESRLSLLSQCAWEQLRCKALPYVVKKDVRRGRYQLFDTLNEAYGYELLLKDGYEKETIEFIERPKGRKKKSPDLKGSRKGDIALVEVKTINHSDCEGEYLRENEAHSKVVISDNLDADEWQFKRRHTVPPTGNLITKINDDIDKALEQLNSASHNAKARKIVLVLLRLDTSTLRGKQLDEPKENIINRWREACEVKLEVISHFV